MQSLTQQFTDWIESPDPAASPAAKPKRTRKPKEETAPESVEVVAYKGFNRDLSCNGYQYAVGQTFEHDGPVRPCSSGFHSCENPLDVWNYYGPCDTRFAVVRASGEVRRHGEDSKIASARLHIEAELSLPEFIKRAVQFVMDACKGGGERVQAASGHYSKLAASGDSSQLAASGDSSKLAASGHYSKLAASGDYSKLAASGDSSTLECSGKNGVIAASSVFAIAKGADGTWVSLAGYDHNGKCVGFATGCIGRDGLKADTWYRAEDGKLVEA